MSSRAATHTAPPRRLIIGMMGQNVRILRLSNSLPLLSLLSCRLVLMRRRGFLVLKNPIRELDGNRAESWLRVQTELKAMQI